MKGVLEGADIRDTEVPVICNVTAAPVLKALELRDLLYRQLFTPVRWSEAFEKAGAGCAAEMGPGRVLAGLMKKVNASIRVLPAHAPAEIETALTEMEKI
jgi:[acyl-carrier-protein] S-malonyltransferase